MKTEFKMGMKVNTTFIMIMLFYSFVTFCRTNDNNYVFKT